jgi:hypothetical protein
VSDAQARIRHSAALEAAVGLFKAPDRAELLHASALPDDVLTVIRIASGDRALAEVCEEICGLPVDALQEACVFYIQSVLFHPDSDHFRVLGASREAYQDTLKQHYRWLQKWLHPDRDPEGWSSVYSHRVNIAWDTLKRPDRRAAYRESLPHVVPAGDGAQVPLPRSISTLRVAPVDAGTPLALSSKWIRRLSATMAVVTVAVAAGLWAAHRAGQGMLEAGDRRPAAASVVAGGERSEPAAPAMVIAEPIETPVDGGLSAEATSVADASTAGAGTPAAMSDPQPVAAPPAAVAPVAAVTPPSDRPASNPDRVTDAAVPLASAPANATTVSSSKPAPAAAAVIVADAGSERVASTSPARDAAAAAQPAPARMVADATPAPPRPRQEPAPAEASAAPAAIASGAGAPIVRDAPTADSIRPPAPAVAAVPATPVAAVPTVPTASADASLLPSADTRPAPLAAASSAAPSPEQVRDGTRLIREFSEAYRSGEVQRVVVLFKPNARTPEGNLIDLHGEYQNLFAQSSRRSLEFLQIHWRPTEGGLVGTGRYEWAMRPRDGSRVRAAGGQFRIVIEFDGGRPLIARFEQQDVG